MVLQLNSHGSITAGQDIRVAFRYPELYGNTDRPVRFFYPAGEYTSNGENVPTQPNAFTDKIFWAK